MTGVERDGQVSGDGDGGRVRGWLHGEVVKRVRQQMGFIMKERQEEADGERPKGKHRRDEKEGRKCLSQRVNDGVEGGGRRGAVDS